MDRKYRYSLLKKSIIDDFELKGGWVLDNTDLTDNKKYKYGTLKYNHGDTNLILFQGFPSKSNKSFNLNVDQKYNDIFGRIVDDSYNYVHCHNATEMSLHIMDSPVEEQELYVKYFTVSNFSPDEDLKLDTLFLDYNLLDKWINPVQHFVPLNDGKGITYESDGTKLLSQINNHGTVYSVYISGNVNKNIKGAREVYFKNTSFIKIVSDTSIDDVIAVKFANSFGKLLSCILDFPVNTLLVSKRESLKNSRKQENIYYESLYPTKEFSHKTKFLFPYNKFDINKLIHNWFNMSDELRMLVDDYLLTVVYNETIENQLINLTEGIESYYRNLDINLLEKLKKFINELPQVIQEELSNYIIDMDEWLKGIKDTRVFIAHGNVKSHKIDNMNEIIIRVSALRLLVQCFIMDKLGFDFSSINNRYSQIFIELSNVFNTTFL